MESVNSTPTEQAPGSSVSSNQDVSPESETKKKSRLKLTKSRRSRTVEKGPKKASATKTDHVDLDLIELKAPTVHLSPELKGAQLPGSPQRLADSPLRVEQNCEMSPVSDDSKSLLQPREVSEQDVGNDTDARTSRQGKLVKRLRSDSDSSDEEIRNSQFSSGGAVSSPAKRRTKRCLVMTGAASDEHEDNDDTVPPKCDKPRGESCTKNEGEDAQEDRGEDAKEQISDSDSEICAADGPSGSVSPQITRNQANRNTDTMNEDLSKFGSNVTKRSRKGSVSSSSDSEEDQPIRRSSGRTVRGIADILLGKSPRNRPGAERKSPRQQSSPAATKDDFSQSGSEDVIVAATPTLPSNSRLKRKPKLKSADGSESCSREKQEANDTELVQAVDKLHMKKTSISQASSKSESLSEGVICDTPVESVTPRWKRKRKSRTDEPKSAIEMEGIAAPEENRKFLVDSESDMFSDSPAATPRKTKKARVTSEDDVVPPTPPKSTKMLNSSIHAASPEAADSQSFKKPRRTPQKTKSSQSQPDSESLLAPPRVTNQNSKEAPAKTSNAVQPTDGDSGKHSVHD